MQSFTEKLFRSLLQSKAVSQATGLTANELAENYSFDKKNTSTVLGNLHRKKLANRSLEQKVPGLRGEYRYWLVDGVEGKAVFGRRPSQSKRQQANRRAEDKKHTNGSGESYMMVIKGPNEFSLMAKIAPEKLAVVIAAANGGK